MKKHKTNEVPAAINERDTPGLVDASCAAGGLDVGTGMALRDAHAVLLDAGLRCTLDRRPRLLPEDAAIKQARAAIHAAWQALL